MAISPFTITLERPTSLKKTIEQLYPSLYMYIPTFAPICTTPAFTFLLFFTSLLDWQSFGRLSFLYPPFHLISLALARTYNPIIVKWPFFLFYQPLYPSRELRICLFFLWSSCPWIIWSIKSAHCFATVLHASFWVQSTWIRSALISLKLVSRQWTRLYFWIAPSSFP